MWDWPKYLMACLLQIYPQNTILTSLPVTYGYGFQQLGGPAKSLKEFCFCVFGKFQPAEGLIFCLFKSSRTWERWDNLVLFTPLGALRNNKCKSAPPPPPTILLLFRSAGVCNWIKHLGRAKLWRMLHDIEPHWRRATHRLPWHNFWLTILLSILVPVLVNPQYTHPKVTCASCKRVINNIEDH